MKTIVLLMSLVFSFNVQASSFQDYCSTADGSVKTADGHNEFYLKVTEYGEYVGQKKEIDLIGKASVVTEKEISVVSDLGTMNDPCALPYVGPVVAYWDKTVVKEITIEKNDGSKFSENTLGVSKDLQSVKATVICRSTGDSQIYCGGEEK